MHSNLPHKTNKFYLIDFKSIYNELTNETNKEKYFHINSFLFILNETGNEKMNSLFEYDTLLADTIRAKKNMDKFIKEKYISKKLINYLELDFSENYLQSLNRTLYIEGICLPIIIYNLFIGANINYSQLNKSVYDIASQAEHETTQINYLKLNDSLTFENINNESLFGYEFKGELTQVYDIQNASNQTSSKKCLNLNNKTIVISQILKNKTNKLEIDYQAIIRIQNHLKSNFIELNWCNKNNNSIVSSYFQYLSLNEKEIWMKEIFIKMFASLENNISNKQNLLQLLDMISSCQISMIGYLNLDTLAIDDENGQLVLAILIETNELQLNNYFHRKLILFKKSNAIETTNIEMIDLRKIRIKLKDNFIRIDFENRYFILRSHGYFNNLKIWHDEILAKTQMNFISLNDQYLTKENVPILIEKLCSFVEFNYILDKQYYSGLKIMKNNSKSNSLMNKLLKEKGYELNLHSDSLNSLNLFKSFFSTYFIPKYGILFVKSFAKFFDATSEQALKNNLDKYSNKQDFANSKISFSALQKNEYQIETEYEILINLEKFRNFLYKQSQTNATFYYTLRRIFIHLYLISKFKEINKMNEKYLAEIFSPLLFDIKSTPQLIISLRQSIEQLNFKETFDFTKYFMFENIFNFYFTQLTKCLIENCQFLFNLKENYLQTQLKIIERSFELNKMNRFSLLNNIVEKKIKYLITIYVENKKNEKSFQFSIDSDTTCQDILQLNDFSRNFSLFEIFDCEQHKLIAGKFYSANNSDSICLQRLLPLNLKLFEILSKWNKFYLCLKKDEEQILDQSPESFEFDEKCEFILYCRNCGYFNNYNNKSNDTLSECNYNSHHKKWKNTHLFIQNETIKIFKQRNQDESIMTQENNSKFKLIYEIQIEDLICYHGLYYNSSSEVCLDTNKSGWVIPNEILISEDECLTFYDKKLNNVLCVHLKSKQSALKLYQIVYENAYHENFKNHIVFTNDSSKSRLCKISTESNLSKNSISRMLRKIIRK